MASILFHEGMSQVMGAGNLLTDTVKAYCVSSGFVPAATSVFADITAGQKEGSAQTLAGKSITNGIFSASDPVFDDVADLDDNITQVVFTITVSATEYLLCVDDVPDLNPDGSNITYQVDSTNGILKIQKTS